MQQSLTRILYKIKDYCEFQASFFPPLKYCYSLCEPLSWAKDQTQVFVHVLLTCLHSSPFTSELLTINKP